MHAQVKGIACEVLVGRNLWGGKNGLSCLTALQIIVTQEREGACLQDESLTDPESVTGTKVLRKEEIHCAFWS